VALAKKNLFCIKCGPCFFGSAVPHLPDENSLDKAGSKWSTITFVRTGHFTARPSPKRQDQVQIGTKGEEEASTKIFPLTHHPKAGLYLYLPIIYILFYIHNTNALLHQKAKKKTRSESNTSKRDAAAVQLFRQKRLAQGGGVGHETIS